MLAVKVERKKVNQSADAAGEWIERRGVGVRILSILIAIVVLGAWRSFFVLVGLKQVLHRSFWNFSLTRCGKDGCIESFHLLWKKGNLWRLILFIDELFETRPGLLTPLWWRTEPSYHQHARQLCNGWWNQSLVNPLPRCWWTELVDVAIDTTADDRHHSGLSTPQRTIDYIRQPSWLFGEDDGATRPASYDSDIDSDKVSL